MKIKLLSREEMDPLRDFFAMARERNESVTPRTPSLPLSELVISRKLVVAARGEEDGAA